MYENDAIDLALYEPHTWDEKYSGCRYINSRYFTGQLSREAGILLQFFALVTKSPCYQLKYDRSEPRHIRQRTPEWMELRKDGSLASSNIGTAVGFFGFKKAKALQQKFLENLNQVKLPNIDEAKCAKP